MAWNTLWSRNTKERNGYVYMENESESRKKHVEKVKNVYFFNLRGYTIFLLHFSEIWHSLYIKNINTDLLKRWFIFKNFLILAPSI